MGFFSSILGGVLGAKAGKDNSQSIKELAQGDKDFYTQNWNNALQANRVNQYNPTGSLTWTKDAQGNWTQNVTDAPAEAQQRDLYRQIMANRLSAAAGIDLGAYSKPIDWNSLGLGHLAQAVGVSQGNTGKRDWYDDPIAGMAHEAPRPAIGQATPSVPGASMGGQLLRPMGNVPVPPSQQPMPSAPSGPDSAAAAALQAQIAQLTQQLEALKSGAGGNMGGWGGESWGNTANMSQGA